MADAGMTTPDRPHRPGRVVPFDATITLGSVLQMIVVICLGIGFLLNSQRADSDSNGRQDKELVAHDVKITQLQSDLLELRRQQKDDMVDVRASLKAISDSLYDIKAALPRPPAK